MKRLIFKLSLLLLLTAGVFWTEKSVEVVHASACDANSQFSLFQNCDNGFYDTRSNYLNRSQICYDQAVQNCAPTYSTTCMTDYQYSCQTSMINAYDQRYPTYGNCINQYEGMFYDIDLCTYQPDYCPEAYTRRDQCMAVYQSSEQTYDDHQTMSACIVAIPHRESCPGLQIYE